MKLFPKPLPLLLELEQYEGDIEKGEWVKCVGSLMGKCHETSCPAFFGHYFEEQYLCTCEEKECEEINEKVSCVRIRG